MKTTSGVACVIASAACACGCAANLTEHRVFGASRPAELVPMTEILADPARYAGQRVRFRGYIVNRFEVHGLFPDAPGAHGTNRSVLVTRLPRCLADEPAEWAATRRPEPPALWWELAREDPSTSPTPEALPRALAGADVVVEGVFEPCMSGHRADYPGGVVLTYIGVLREGG